MVVETARLPEQLSVGSHEDADRCVVAVRGEVDMVTAPDLSRYLDECLDEAVRALVIDLENVTFLGTSGLAVLADAKVRADNRGLEFAITAGDGPIRRYLSLVGLDRA